jgi:hypothetical protein
MKNKLTIILSFALMLFPLLVTAQSERRADREMIEWRYEVEAVQTGAEGTYLVKVWSYSKKPNIAIEQAKKNAVHGVIFKGVAANERIPGQRALTNNANLEMEKQDFFQDFFADGGKYMKFVNITGDGSVRPEDRMKIGKEYKIGVVVSVNVQLLRSDLESAGILRGLNSGF